jgi:DNA repair protein RadC
MTAFASRDDLAVSPPLPPPRGCPADRRTRTLPPPEPADSLARTDAELVAVLLGHGRPRGDHFDLARSLLITMGGLGGLAQTSVAEMLSVRGLGVARATVLTTAMELGRRSAGRRPERGQRLAAASEVYAHYRARLGSTCTEEFWVTGLDVRHRLIFEACIARGSLTGVEVHPREVFRPLIRAAAAAVIFCHNHPSGDPTPSRQDFDLTARLKEVGQLCGITVLDHVVVGADGYISLAERGWL